MTDKSNIKLMVNNERLKLDKKGLQAILNPVKSRAYISIGTESIVRRDREPSGCASSSVIKLTLETISKVLINGLN
jgi:hypothetical protein